MVTTFNFPTLILYGVGALEQGCQQLAATGMKKVLVVTDQNLVKLGLHHQLVKSLNGYGVTSTIFDQVRPNPHEDDIIQGAKLYCQQKCELLVAIGGGAVIDSAKAIAILVNHDGPLSLYDDVKGGDKLITGELPEIIAIPTTAGTGSEVGRSAVIITIDQGVKTILFHPNLLPTFALLDPNLTIKLPPPITAASGVDALIHAIEAYFSPNFHPMADGIALEGIRLIVENLPTCYQRGEDLEARGKMLLAATMGATAFQKGLGMIHSMAHALSAYYDMHHGLACALLTPCAISFLEQSTLTDQQQKKLETINTLFVNGGTGLSTLSATLEKFIQDLGASFGLHHHGVQADDLAVLAKVAYADPCHQANLVPVTEDDLLTVFKKAF
ncbi:MAG: iron-containing alcohol dehydrogenase [Bdellovibrionales bacterium]|nr:iron-containing alcohol dehydrogenase [Bdellovibrionales bacterium]MBT3525859.1 iron-containing alcohol dehydrogenase [Bdellovibrionales bacterium]MBT7670108.1 iron-containing alcohol dehydrogenase [Bdellovibrionales bacterium]MBT7766595.1 iron-containing alcohol dehydrogenase [Bdellovibrionales bacterium]